METESLPKIVLAVDGGGSKTLVWIARVSPNAASQDSEPAIIGRGQSGPGNPRSVGFDQAFFNIESAVRAALQESEVDPTSIAAACISLAGAGRSEEQQRVKDWADKLQIAQQIIVVDDVEPMRFAAEMEHRSPTHTNTLEETNAWRRSITLVVGTGSIAQGCDENGLTVRAGGWGYLLGDEGSGYAIGLSGLRSLCDAHDQGIELSAFQKAVLQQLQLSDPTQLIGWIYQSPIPRPLIAELAGTILAFVTQDPIADRIAVEAVTAMVKNIVTVAKRLKFSRFEYALAMSGGILQNHPLMSRCLSDELSNHELSPSLSHVVRQPIYGAILIASKHL